MATRTQLMSAQRRREAGRYRSVKVTDGQDRRRALLDEDSELRARITAANRGLRAHSVRSSLRLPLAVPTSTRSPLYGALRANKFSGMPLPLSVARGALLAGRMDMRGIPTLPIVLEGTQSWCATYADTAKWEIGRVRSMDVVEGEGPAPDGGRVVRATMQESPPTALPGDCAAQYLSTAGATLRRIYSTRCAVDAQNVVLLLRTLWFLVSTGGSLCDPRALYDLHARATDCKGRDKVAGGDGAGGRSPSVDPAAEQGPNAATSAMLQLANWA